MYIVNPHANTTYANVMQKYTVAYAKKFAYAKYMQILINIRL